MIRLGYELRTGKAVDIPLDHTAVTGRTQQSGKTTTLEALVHRSGLRAVVFVTKKAESGFRQARTIPPFFIESADWQFVSAVLESTIRENLKFERSWIMDACKGASTLKQVQENILVSLHGIKNEHYGKKEKGRKRDDREWMKKPATGLSYSVLNVLNAYLEIVVPQIETLPYTKTLALGPGLNVMDLHQYSTELQALVIRSVLEWVYQHERNTVVIIPEAWEFIPQNRRSPVLLAAEELIRKGAASKNFVWLDAQDIAAMHKSVLRSVGVWILGVQREANEIKRMLNHIPAPRPSATDVMQLERGQFFVCYQNVMRKTYVQPFWVGDEHARAIATGEESTNSVEKIWSETERELVAPTPERKHPAQGAAQGTRLGALGDEARNETGVVLGEGRKYELKKIWSKTEIEFDTIPPGQALSCDPVDGTTKSEDAVWKQKYEESQREVESLKADVNRLTDIIAHAGLTKEFVESAQVPPEFKRVLKGTFVEPADEFFPGTPRASGDPLPPTNMGSVNEHTPACEQLFSQLKARLLKDAQVIAVLDARPKIVLNIQRPTLDLDASTLKGLICKFVSCGFFKSPRTGVEVTAEVRRHGGDAHSSRVNLALYKLTEMSILLREESGYQINPQAQIEVKEVK